MATGDITKVLKTALTGSGDIHGLASSSTLLAGYARAAVDTTSPSPTATEFEHSGKIKLGTSPAAGTQIQIWAIPSIDGTNWPTGFSGSAGAVTPASAGILAGYAKLAQVINVDVTTTGQVCDYEFSASAVFNGPLPKKYQLWFVHNTGVALDATAGSHTYTDIGSYQNVSP